MLDKVNKSMTFRSSPADRRAEVATSLVDSLLMAEPHMSASSLPIATALIALIDKSFIITFFVLLI